MSADSHSWMRANPSSPLFFRLAVALHSDFPFRCSLPVCFPKAFAFLCRLLTRTLYPPPLFFCWFFCFFCSAFSEPFHWWSGPRLRPSTITLWLFPYPPDATPNYSSSFCFFVFFFLLVFQGRVPHLTLSVFFSPSVILTLLTSSFSPPFFSPTPGVRICLLPQRLFLFPRNDGSAGPIPVGLFPSLPTSCSLRLQFSGWPNVVTGPRY